MIRRVLFMPSNRRTKLQAEIDKSRLKLVEQQARIKELDNKMTELENMEIVDIVRGMSIPLDDLTAVLQSIKGGVAPAATTSGQVVPKSQAPKILTEKPEKENDSE